MKKLLATLALVLGLATSAAGWDLSTLNKTVNQTNFILDNICSATLIDTKQRLVLTNYHCVDDKVVFEDREEIQPDGTVKKVKRAKYTDVTLSQRAYKDADQVGASEYVAEIIATKKRADLALLRIKADTIPHTIQSHLLPPSGKVQRGERVYIVGNPKMLDASVVEGVVSSVTRTYEVPWAEGEKVPFYQISGGLAGGNSGGSLYNNDGQLIGVPAMGYRDAEHLGFAIQAKAIHLFLTEACYANVFDTSAKDPEACKAEKKAAAEKKKNADSGSN